MALNPNLYRRAAGLLGGVSLLTLALLSTADARAQGCVAVRGGGMCLLPHGHDGLTPQDSSLGGGDWLVGVSYRWLHSDRHFVGDEEQPQRQANGTEVINNSHFVDLSVQYAFTPRWSAGVTLPWVNSDRSSLYEHKGNASGERYHTQADGIGDVRAVAYAWILDPAKMPQWNLQLGLGFKAPTGESAATDTFYRTTGPVVDYVDQSIQPGDGGWGLVTELNGYWLFMPRATAYVQGSYLFNPQEMNDTPNRARSTYYSVTDQYFGRAGVSYVIVPKWGLSLSLGGRIEGVPVYDAIGGDDGFRRPGFSIGIEPGLEVMKGRYFAAVTAPVALYRNREQSYQDKLRTPPGHGDAAFADYVITVSFGVRF